MPRYSVKADGLTVIFKAVSQRDAIRKAHLISPFYSDLKRLVSRWWHLIWVVVIGLGFYAGQML